MSVLKSFYSSLSGLFGSKKFLTALLGLIAVEICRVRGCSQEQAQETVAVIVALLLGQGATDWGKAAKTSTNLIPITSNKKEDSDTKDQS